MPISSAWLTLDLPLQVILGSMQLSKFKPGGLVIGSLASNIPRAIPHTPHAHPRRLRPTYTGDRVARVGGGEGGAGARDRREELHGGVSEDGWATL